MSAHSEHAYAFATSITLAAIGKFGALAVIMLHWHIPPVIMELAQLFCYIGGGLAGIISAWLFWEKRVKPYLKDRL